MGVFATVTGAVLKVGEGVEGAEIADGTARVLLSVCDE